MAKRKVLNTEQRSQLLYWLKGRCKYENKKLSPGICSRAAFEWGVSTQTVSRLWSKFRKLGAQVALRNNYKLKCGSKRLVMDMEKLKNIPHNKRGTVRSTAKQLGIPKSTLQDHISYGDFKIIRSAVKPLLTENNKFERIKYCLGKLIPDATLGEAKFQEDFNTIHVDEKWFYQTTVVRKIIMAPDEIEPTRQTQSKRYITKVMFMCAVARPRGDFDGKIGIWAFTTTEQAQRNSKNHRRGDLVVKPQNIDKDVYREMLIDNVLPAILEKFPDTNATIIVQQDNAGPHIQPDDPDWLEAVESTGWDINLNFQPPNSPDLNVNDLGFFRSIQSISQEEVPRNVPELVACVKSAFDQYQPESINKIWLSHQQAMVQTLLSKGNNNYKLTHMNKNKLIKEGKLPQALSIPLGLYDDSRQFLLENGYFQ